MIWGETGTRLGATHRQIATVAWLWAKWGLDRLHNGDCIGVDEQLYYLVKAFQFRVDVSIHPPTIEKHRAWCGQHDLMTTVLAEKAYLVRDRDIVDDAFVMVGVPRQQSEPKESWRRGNGGTWYTINYTRDQGKPLAIVWPNGSVDYERWELVTRRSR